MVYVKTNGSVSQNFDARDYINEPTLLSNLPISANNEISNNRPTNNGLVIYDIGENDNEDRVSQSDLDGKGNENDEETKNSEEDNVTAKLYQIILPNGILINGTTFVKSQTNTSMHENS